MNKNSKALKVLWFGLCSIMVLLNEHLALFNLFIPLRINFIIHALLSVFIFYINLHPDAINTIQNKKLHHCAGGVFLLKLFLFTTAVSVIIVLFNPYYLIRTLVWIFIIEFIIFWNGIIRTYLYSSQMGIKLRVTGAVCGMIPVVHLFVLFKIIRTVDYEIEVESAKEQLNEQRKSKQICKTKYPVVMIHGVFFRDFKHFNYWGRIPAELEKNGAQIFYGNHESASPIDKSGEQLAERIKEILKETGAEKVNIIAHSKGGLDSRYMISKCGMENYVASLTTINTPHRGCEFADYLLDGTIPEKTKQAVALTYNNALKLLGDKEPDFISAVTDLTKSSCTAFNEKIKDSGLVYYQSFGSVLKRPEGGRFPLNYSYNLVKRFDGPNDGLVDEKSFEWGSKFTMLTPQGKRGISHGDMIDLNRENIRGFDAREFYVQLVSELREMGF